MTKLIVLAPSAGGKSTLMRFMREYTALNIREMDEEIIRENNGRWPDSDEYKDQVLVPKIVRKILDEDDVLFLTSYVPEGLLIKARNTGFKVLLLEVRFSELNRRNKERASAEKYADASPWLQLQIDTFSRLKGEGMVDGVIDGHSSTKDIATAISSYAAPPRDQT